MDNGKRKKEEKPLLLLSFDIEEFDLPQEYGAAVPEREKFEISRKGTERILALLAKHNVHATFFITGAFARKYPSLIRQMAEEGHETASHGMDHSFFEIAHLKESCDILKEISGVDSVPGFRMARLAEVDKKEILRAGYRYESSLNPVWLPGRYNNFSAPLLPFRESCGLLQFPVSALPLVRFPLFWLSFKCLPLPLYKLLSVITVKMTRYFNMYSHPWEYCEEASDKKWQIPSYIVKHAGNAQLARLEELILCLGKRGRFVTFQEFMKEENRL
ncbi:MAG: polysaccharide deacetylase family protein [Lentisphaeria bacterium]|nr:polysaccharide deacetylase family protein [Lentisphaeria bacterium]